MVMLGCTRCVMLFLGALSLGDIGQHFPPCDPKWKDVSSDQFLQFALEKVKDAGGYVTLLDVPLICEAQKSDHTET